MIIIINRTFKAKRIDAGCSASFCPQYNRAHMHAIKHSGMYIERESVCVRTQSVHSIGVGGTYVELCPNSFVLQCGTCKSG